MIRVVLVDDQELVRTGLAMVVDSQDDMRVVGQAGDGVAALEVLATTPADVVLMDVRMPRMDGIETTRRILARDPDGPRVVVVTTFDLDEHAFAALKAGASGFLLKDASAEDVLSAIRTVHGGDAVLAPSTTKRLIAHVAGDLPGPRTRSGPAGAADRHGSARCWSRWPPARATPRSRADVPLRGDRQDPRRAAPGQARPARPRAGGRARLRGRPRPPRLLTSREALEPPNQPIHTPAPPLVEVRAARSARASKPSEQRARGGLVSRLAPLAPQPASAARRWLRCERREASRASKPTNPHARATVG